MSMISDSTTNVTGEVSDSNRRNYCIESNKRPRHDNGVSTSRFKGVVCQANGHWGAQIYANHVRIWLGTFKSEKEAAMAYDSAAIIIRSGDPHRNFPWTHITVQEPKFQSLFDKDALVNMIKDGSYPSKFADFVRAQFQKGEFEVGPSLTPVHASKGSLCRQYFQKELTPSDVGKLNRLVIPKKYALKYFPPISEDSNGGVSNMPLVFYDGLMRSWEFRYCYWKSSQSFVFTRGWNRFVKEKELKAKDMVIFSTCEYDGRSFCVIDVSYNDGVEGVVDNINVDNEMRRTLQLSTRKNYDDGENDEEFEEVKLELGLGKENVYGEEEKKFVGTKSTEPERNGLWLFGVQII
ncbi:AP2/ERF and B3 domain-containing transcription factor At1g51120-like [Cornus florida]|uniref:AP2/ERF and B3 domain-containing transcription factor At1g51120-like n=1 Tax=Cornus florida TaxID=4283 RepID=UPI0028A11F6E|nr:AP2/ERF and B3 domain-containing transcription factor At1g51120-like [Cornus florida]